MQTSFYYGTIAAEMASYGSFAKKQEKVIKATVESIILEDGTCSIQLYDP